MDSLLNGSMGVSARWVAAFEGSMVSSTRTLRTLFRHRPQATIRESSESQ